MNEGVLLQVYDLWRYGGMVMPALFTTAFVLWTALGLRLLRLRRGDTRPLRALVRATFHQPTGPAKGVIHEAALRAVRLVHDHGSPVARPFLDEALGDLEDRLRAGTGLVQVLVSVAPLMGLLGTVTGLIGTFGSLGASATSTQSEGIAGGIVEALYATQMGLAIAVPGLLMSGILHHRQQRLEAEIEELKALLGGAWRPA